MPALGLHTFDPGFQGYSQMGETWGATADAIAAPKEANRIAENISTINSLVVKQY